MIVIDAGNTNIVIGFYTKNKLNKIFSVAGGGDTFALINNINILNAS